MSGLIYLFTGNGKGKTSAALGVVVRAVCAGMKVAWVAWYKEDAWPISEKKLSELLPVEMFFLGKGFYIKVPSTEYQVPSSNKPGTKNLGRGTKIKTAPLQGGGTVVDDNAPNEHRQAALAAWQKAIELLKTNDFDLLVCDEINNALHENLLTEDEVDALIENRKKTHLILTGRDASAKLIANADLVTEMKKIKHPYDQGIKAVNGLDF